VRFEHLRSAGCVDVLSPWRHLSIAEVLNNLEHLRPAWEGALVDLFVLIDGHDELEEFAGNLALFRRPTDFASSPSGAATPIHPGSTIYHGLPAFGAPAATTTLRSRVVV
jgi:hypothetical protein